MIDTAQAVLLLVVVILTILLVILGTQVFFILKEVRKTLGKANKVLDDASSITESITGPITAFSTLAAGLKTGSFVATLLKRKNKIIEKVFGDDDEEEEEN